MQAISIVPVVDRSQRTPRARHRVIWPSPRLIKWRYARRAVLSVRDHLRLEATVIPRDTADALGRVTANTVTALGSNIGGQIDQITQTFDARGLVQNVTSLALTSADNEVAFTLQRALADRVDLTGDWLSRDGKRTDAG